ncbi:hypothetical protein SPRG_18342, partial [Saprolegnia parasitica CBS 223.65]
LAKREKKEKADAKKAGAKRKADTTTDEAPRAKKSASGSDRLAEIDAVELDEDAPVYDDCDVVRDHLQQFFLAKEASQVNLAKHLGFSITPLRNFLMKKGRREGSGSAVYGAAYRFFEKRRLLDGLPKSAKRLKIEKTLPEGYPLRKDPTHYYLLPGEEVPTTSEAADQVPAGPAPVLSASEESDDPDDEKYDLMLREKWSCNAIRSKIQKFLATKVMTQTAFLKDIGANSNSYQRFMKLKGPYGGCDNSTYSGSLHFFYQREKKEKKAKAAAKAAAPKRKKAASNDDSEDEAPLASAKKAKTTKLSGADRLAQIEAVELPEKLHVYDDCDVVRDHLQQFILAKECTQVALSAHLGFSVASLRKYLAMHGKREGSGSIVYKTAYFFFEKLRLLENKPKTNKRLKMEKTMPQGYSLERDSKYGWVYCP